MFFNEGPACDGELYREIMGIEIAKPLNRVSGYDGEKGVGARGAS
jgi:hypothetical protein